jgi:protein involved in polysaccharide export with SLBB domain
VQNCSFIWNRRTNLSVTASLVYLFLIAGGFAQQLQTPSLPTGLPSTLPSTPSSASASATASTEEDKASARDRNNGGSGSLNSNGTLTASQIITIVQARPELIVDLKQVMADYLEQQGTPVQVDSITDDMLYRGIGSDAGLRGAISIWLRARGYVSDSDFDRSDMDPRSSDDLTGNMSATPLGLPNLLASGDTADSARIDRNGSLSNSANSDGIQGGRNASRRPEGRDVSSASKPDRNNPSAVEVVHQTAPYNLQSLRDLYTQVPEQTAKLKRFGSDMFLNRGLDTKQMSVDIPIGPDYILGVGDGLTINLWGGVSQSFSRTVDREGKIVLPEAGTIVVAGLPLERAQALVQSSLSQQFRDAKVAVTIARLRTVRVYVVGDVQRPGAYDISSLSTPLNALYAAGGPTSIGSLRVARHFRGKELVREVDLYEFLLRGVRPDTERIQDGDTILVSPVGRQVAVAGMVKRPAIYELKNETKLSDVLNDAGGVLVSASLTHITIERIGTQGHRATLTLDLPDGSTAESSK